MNIPPDILDASRPPSGMSRAARLLFLVALLPLVARADDYSWNSSSSAAWRFATSWIATPNPAVAPGPTEAHNIVTPTLFGTLQLGGDRAAHDLTYNSSNNWTLSNANATASSNMALTGSLTKSGTGELHLTSTGSAYDFNTLTVSGGVTVNAGTLLFGDSINKQIRTISIGGSTTVASAATLRIEADSATFGGGLSVAGVLIGDGRLAAAGASSIVLASGGVIGPRTINIGTFTFDGGQTTGTSVDLSAGSFMVTFGTGNASDSIAFWNYAGVGDVVLNGLTLVTVTGTTGSDSVTVQAGTYTLFSFYSDSGTTAVDSGLTGGLSLGAGFENFNGAFDYSGNTIQLTLTAIDAVPEPSTWAVLLLGVLLGAGRAVVRSRRQI